MRAKKFLCLLMVVLMVASLLPVSALAAGEDIVLASGVKLSALKNEISGLPGDSQIVRLRYSNDGGATWAGFDPDVDIDNLEASSVLALLASLNSALNTTIADGSYTYECAYAVIEYSNVMGMQIPVGIKGTGSLDGTFRVGCEFGDWEALEDGEHHGRECIDNCGASETAPHEFTKVEVVGDGDAHKLVCSVCEYEKAESHTWSVLSETEEEIVYECACGATYTKVIIPEHTCEFGAWSNIGDANYHVAKCSCGETKTEAHSFGDCTIKNDNYHVSSCTVCGYEKTAMHSFGGWTKADENQHVRQCECGQEEYADHAWIVIDEIPATGTVEGKIVYGCEAEGCDAQKAEIIPATGFVAKDMTIDRLDTANYSEVDLYDQIKAAGQTGNDIVAYRAKGSADWSYMVTNAAVLSLIAGYGPNESKTLTAEAYEYRLFKATDQQLVALGLMAFNGASGSALLAEINKEAYQSSWSDSGDINWNIQYKISFSFEGVTNGGVKIGGTTYAAAGDVIVNAGTNIEEAVEIENYTVSAFWNDAAITLPCIPAASGALKLVYAPAAEADKAIAKVNVTGSGAVTINSSEVPASGLELLAGEDWEVKVVPADGWFVSSVSVEGTLLTMIRQEDGSVIVSFDGSEKDGEYVFEVLLKEAKFTFKDNREMDIYTVNNSEDLSKDVYEAVVEDPTLDDAESYTVKYLAREATTVAVPVNLDLTFIQINETYNIPLGALWVDVDEEIASADKDNAVNAIIEQLLYTYEHNGVGAAIEAASNLKDDLTEALYYYGAHSFGVNGTETLALTYKDSDKFMAGQTDITIVDNRAATTVSGNNVSFVYGEMTKDQLEAAIAPVVTDANGNTVSQPPVEFVTNTEVLAQEDVGTYTVQFKFLGNDDCKPSTGAVTVTINKATTAIDYDSMVVKYGTDYTVKLINPDNVDCIEVMIGVDVANAYGVDATLQMKVSPFVAALLDTVAAATGVALDDGISLSEVESLLKSDMVAQFGLSLDSVTELLEQIRSILAEIGIGDVTVALVDEFKPDVGVYVLAAVSFDGNYETAYTLDYLVVYPDGEKVELLWNQQDANGIITLPTYEDFDLGATADIAEAQSEVAYLFLGADMDDENYVFISTDIERVEGLGASSFVQIAYIRDWGNEMYYAVPLVRSLTVVPNVYNVTVEDGVAVYNGEPHAANVTVTTKAGEPVEAGDKLTVNYSAILADGTVYNSTEAPVHAGVYAVSAIYYDGENAGMDVGTLTIYPAAIEIAVNYEENLAQYDGNPAGFPNITVKGEINDGEANVVVIQATLAANGPVTLDDLTAAYGNVNIDLPTAIDNLLKDHVESAYNGTGITPALVISKLNALKDVLTEMGYENATINALIEKVELLPESTSVTFLEWNDESLNPTDKGVYLFAGMVFDPDYAVAVDSDWLFITNVVNVTIVDENGEPNPDRLFTYDTTAKSVDVIVTDLEGNELASTLGDNAEGITVYYAGVRVDAEDDNLLYARTAAPDHVGLYTVVAFYSDETHAGMDIGAMTIVPAEASVNVESQPHLYDGDAVDLGVTSTGVNGDTPKFAVITAGIATDGDADDFDMIEGVVNIDLPAELDNVIAPVVEKYTGKNFNEGTLSIGAFKLMGKVIELAIEAAGESTEAFEQLLSIIDKMPDTVKLSFHNEGPSEVGTYAIIAMTMDPDYCVAMDTALVVIYPTVNEALAPHWNQFIPGFVPFNELGSTDFGASVYRVSVDESGSDVFEAEIDNNIIFGIAADADNVLILRKVHEGQSIDRAGIYEQIAYMDDTTVVALPILRSFVVLPTNADIEFYDENGNTNFLRHFTYDGEAKEMKARVVDSIVNSTVLVEDIAAVRPSGVWYIGVSAGAKGYFSNEAPSDAGVYDVIAYYVDDSKGIYAFGTGAMIIENADLGLKVIDTTVAYDGEEHLPTIEWTCADHEADYVTIVNVDGVVNIDLSKSPSLSALAEYLPATEIDVAGVAEEIEAAAAECGIEVAADFLNALVAEIKATGVSKVTVNGSNPVEIGEYTVYAIAFAENHYSDVASGKLYIQGVSGILGDVDSDGDVDYVDAILMLKYDAFLIDASDLDLSVADCNADGRVSPYDAVLALQYDAFLTDADGDYVKHDDYGVARSIIVTGTNAEGIGKYVFVD